MEYFILVVEAVSILIVLAGGYTVYWSAYYNLERAGRISFQAHIRENKVIVSASLPFQNVGILDETVTVEIVIWDGEEEIAYKRTEYTLKPGDTYIFNLNIEIPLTKRSEIEVKIGILTLNNMFGLEISSRRRI
ncbi:hypothetical protein DRN93_00585 [archaeon]|nr:MAG: hypothetical protein DRN93_00585 [archaeon]